MSYPHLQEQSQPELTYPLARTRRRWLVVVMGIATLSGLGAASMVRGELTTEIALSLLCCS